MLPPVSYVVAKAEHEIKLREAERIHRLSWSAEHRRPLSMVKRLQNLLARN
jgi:hypothetical protein